MPQKPKSTDKDKLVREEDAAITAENLKLEKRAKANSQGEADKAEEVVRELKRPTKLS